MRAQHQAPLTRAQVAAYRQTGIPMSEEKAVAHLISQLGLEQLRSLNAKCADIKASAAIEKAKAASAASPFAAACGGYADTGADTLDSNFANLRDLPEPLRSTSALQADAIARTDAELSAFVGSILRSPWTKLVAGLLAVAATAVVIGCSGSDEPLAAEHTPAIYQPRTKVTA